MQNCGEIIFKPTIGNERIHQGSNGNGVRIVNFVTFKTLLFRARYSRIGIFINTPGPQLMEKLTVRSITYGRKGDDIRVYSMYDCSGEVTVIFSYYLVVARVREKWQ